MTENRASLYELPCKQIFNPYLPPQVNLWFINLVKSHKEIYEFELLGKRILIYPNVLSPKYEWATEHFIKNLPNCEGKSVLDVGTGTGALALFAAFNGANDVHATDINSAAVENTNANFKKYGVDNFCKAYLSNLFEKVPQGKTFDLILFNPPFQAYEPNDILDASITDHNYETVKKFMKEAKLYLKDKGRMAIYWAELCDLQLLIDLIKENSYEILDRRGEFRNYLEFLQKNQVDVELLVACNKSIREDMGWNQYIYLLGKKNTLQK